MIASVAISVLLLLSFSRPTNTESLGTWTSTTAYPTGTSGIIEQSCATYSGYIYCVGGYGPGLTSAVNYAPVSSSGVGTWTSTTTYPSVILEQSCVISSGYIYCVGGSGPSGAVYYATVSSSGVGKWTSTTTYPTGSNGIEYQSCAIYSSDIYCVGGENFVDTYSAVYDDQINAALTVPSTPRLSIGGIDVSQAVTITGAIPSTGRPRPTPGLG